MGLLLFFVSDLYNYGMMIPTANRDYKPIPEPSMYMIHHENIDV
jgi:hypothetical protein